MSTKNSLFVLRDEINNIDKEIVQLLGKRKHLVFKIAKSKIEQNKEIRDLKREEKMLKKLIIIGKKNNLESEYITRLFQLIIEESVLTQEKLLKQFCINNKLSLGSFSFLGPKGSYSHIAACKYAEKNLKTCITNECSTFEEVLSSVENNQSDYAILPIENSCSGAIGEVCDILKKTKLFIIGEINIVINHCLLGIQKIKFNQIKTIYSHLQPFKQCSNFIKKFPEWKIKYTKSTTDAMQKIIKYNDISNVALGSEIGSKIYGLNILSKNLANKEKNITRFVLLHKNPIKIPEKIPTKTTLIFNIKKGPENFFKVLLILKEKKVNFKKIYKNLLEETFYVDIEENLSSIVMKKILEKIKKITNFLKILGCYPAENIALKKS